MTSLDLQVSPASAAVSSALLLRLPPVAVACQRPAAAASACSSKQASLLLLPWPSGPHAVGTVKKGLDCFLQGSTQLIPATYGRGLAASTTLLDGADLVSATGAATETALPMLTPRDASVEEDNASAGPAGSASKAEADPEPGTHTPRSACLAS